MNGKPPRGYVFQLLQTLITCLVGVSLSGCLQSDDPPMLDPSHVVQIPGLQGLHRLSTSASEKQGEEYYLGFELQSDNHYRVSHFGRKAGEKLNLLEGVGGDVVFIPIRSIESGSKLFLAIDLKWNFYGELRQIGNQSSITGYDLEKNERLIATAQAIAKEKGVILANGRLKGKLTSKDLKKLFSDATFRKALNIEYSPLRPLSTEEKQTFAAAGFDATGKRTAATVSAQSSDIGASQEKPKSVATASLDPKTAGLLTRLQSKVTPGGPFDQALYERVASALVAADPQAIATKELIANAKDFSSNNIRASMFVAYLKEALPTITASKEKEPGGLVWLQEKANGGDMWAKFFLARAHFHVAGKRRERQLAEQFSGLAYPDETRLYWDAYQAILRDQNFAGSFETVVELAEEGLKISFPPLINLKGVMKLYGLGLPKDQVEGVRLVLQAASAEFPNAITLAGYLYLNGEGVQKDEAEALRWFRKGAALGRADAMNGLADMYYQGRGVSKDEAEAVQWYRKAAELGIADGMFNLGWSYASGQGVAKDDVVAVQWYRKAAELGQPDAMFSLGARYAKGQGVGKDDAQAWYWYREAAEGGHVGAMNELGSILLNRQGVSKDDDEAFKWFGKAALGGDSSGMTNLGYMYSSGRGVGKDDAQASNWYQKAAALGRPSAMFNLGVNYENGNGVTRDMKQALEWYQKAAGLGDESAKQAIQRLQAAASAPTGKAAQIGGSAQGWKSAQEWDEAYRNAPVISEADFLKQVTSARLEFSVSANLSQYVPVARLRERVRSVLEQQGFQINEEAPITIKIRWEFQHPVVVKTTERSGSYGYSTDKQEHHVLLWAQLVQFELTTPMYRNGRFYNRKVVPASNWVGNNTVAGDYVVEESIKEEVVGSLLEGIGDAIASMRKDTETTTEGESALWNQGINESMFHSYLNAKKDTNDNVDRVFTEVNGISKLHIDLENDGGMFLNKTNIHNSWANTLPDAKFAYVTNGIGKVQHEIHLIKLNASKLQTLFGNFFSIPYGWMLSSIDIYENNVIELNGRFYRMKHISLWEDLKMEGALWDEVETTIPNFVYGSMRESLKEARFRR